VPNLSDLDVLASLPGEVGAEPDRVRGVLAGTEYADAVRANAEEAHALGGNGVPFLRRRPKCAISGGEPAGAVRHALRTADADQDAALSAADLLD